MQTPVNVPATVAPTTQGDAPAPATVAPTTPAPTQRTATMRAIREGAPEFFAADLSDLFKALTDKTARVAALAMALSGAAIERAQSGNMPKAWAVAKAAAEGLKGAARARALAAVAHVEGIKPGSIKAPDVEAFAAFGYETAATLSALLTPPQAAPRTKGTDWKAECLTARAERDALAAQVAALQQALTEAKAKAKAPATA